MSELLEAVRQHLADEVLPTIQSPRLRFRTLVAANVLDVVTRELALAGEHSQAEGERLVQLLAHEEPLPPSLAGRQQALAQLNRRLCERIEAGRFDGTEAWQELLSHCLATAREKVAVSNPRFLQRLEEEPG